MQALERSDLNLTSNISLGLGILLAASCLCGCGISDSSSKKPISANVEFEGAWNEVDEDLDTKSRVLTSYTVHSKGEMFRIDKVASQPGALSYTTVFDGKDLSTQYHAPFQGIDIEKRPKQSLVEVRAFWRSPSLRRYARNDTTATIAGFPTEMHELIKGDNSIRRRIQLFIHAPTGVILKRIIEERDRTGTLTYKSDIECESIRFGPVDRSVFKRRTSGTKTTPQANQE